MSYGYHGKILRVDLTAGKVKVQEPEQSPSGRLSSGHELR